MAQAQLLGADALVGLDRQRVDVAASQLSVVPAAASTTTAAGLARRFGPEQLAGVEAGLPEVTGRAFDLLPAGRKVALSGQVTVDLDSTDVEVYGSTKQAVAYTYQVGAVQVSGPARGPSAPGGLGRGRAEHGGGAAGRQRRCPAAGGGSAAPRPGRDPRARPGHSPLCGPVAVRADAGYVTADLANAAAETGCDLAIAATRTTAMWRACASIAEQEWVQAVGMPVSQVAAVEHAPAGWPEGTYTIVRRVRLEAELISADPRSRRRRTIDKGQLALALEGAATYAYTVCFIVTTIPANDHPSPTDADTTTHAETTTALEAWFRRRTEVEDRIREARPGAAPRHLPSGHHAINTVWMWAVDVGRGCGPRCSPGTSRSCSKPSPGSTSTAAPTAPGSATSCSASRPAWSATPAA